MVKGPPGTSTSAGSRKASGGAGRLGGPQHGGAAAQLVGDQHGLVVLLLVLGDHPEGEAPR